MKKFIIACCISLCLIQSAFAQVVSHHVKNQGTQHPVKPGFSRSKFTICNKTSSPLFFIAWAIDTWDNKPYRWNDYIGSYQCRTDKIDKYYNVALYEFSYGPGQSLLLDYVLREGRSVDIHDGWLRQS